MTIESKIPPNKSGYQKLIEKTKEEYLSLIKQHFPDVVFESAELFTNGWDNNVIILDKKIVFRFPKRESYIPRFKAEVKLLKYLVPKLPIQVPNYIYLPKDSSFGGYKMLSGIEMSPEALNKLDDNQKNNVAQQLGSFLSILHSTPIQVAKDAGFEEEIGGYWWSKSHAEELYTKSKEVIFPKLTPKEVKWVKHQFEQYLSLSFDIDFSVIHSDFTSDHILFDQNAGLVTGVIDFADTEFSDPALDFAGLWDYGNWLPEKTLTYYTGKTNKDFLKRSKIPRLLGMVSNMMTILEGKELPVTFEDSREDLRKIMGSGLTL